MFDDMSGNDKNLKMLGSTKISPVLRTTIPREVANKLDASDGDFIIYFENEDGQIIIKKG
jgi:bifunctional DNA-binding transcriptional regulator/antitoxin component of YhaV-PrlF toxin-antitoxin module